MDYTEHEARADACLAFRNHTPAEGEVVASSVKFNEKEGRFDVKVEGKYPNGCREGIVYIRRDRGYFLCIHTVVQGNFPSFPHSWNHGWLD